jgi:ElaB/YqjD/DUF883 family membrane-anchored ribosome-binding protein
MTAAEFEQSRDALVKDFIEVLNEADSLLKQANKESGENASDLRAQVESKLRAAKLKLQDMQDDAMDRANATAHATIEYVHDNPWQALGVAVVAGLLAGMQIGRTPGRRFVAVTGIAAAMGVLLYRAFSTVDSGTPEREAGELSF